MRLLERNLVYSRNRQMEAKMGMYDKIYYECVCPVCHKKVTGFQSKSGGCMLDELKPSNVDNFYSECDTCGCWVEFHKNGEGKFRRTVVGRNNKIISKHTKVVSI